MLTTTTKDLGKDKSLIKKINNKAGSITTKVLSIFE